MRRLAALLVVAVALGHLPSAAAAATVTGPQVASQPQVAYQPPVDGPVVDPFRPPPAPWAAGNRGLQYATSPGSPVRAAADGEVTFAGDVAGSLHVVVLHPDGIRTSYSFLASIAVRRGDRVARGQVLGTAGTSMHFGARAGDTYIDPATLFTPDLPRVHLVPDDARGPASEAKERAGLLGLLAGLPSWAGRVGTSAALWAQGAASAAASSAGSAVGDQLDELRLLAQAATSLDPMTDSLRAAEAAYDWAAQRGACTPAGAPVPRLDQRHLAVLVAGLGSSSEHAGVWDLDTAALGYSGADVHRFSYRGGFADESHPYDAHDTERDLREAGRRLRADLERLGAEHPGVPVDVIGHSQGGLVVRSALGDEVDSGDRRLPQIGAVVTLGTPHHGAVLADDVALLDHTAGGQLLEAAAHRGAPAYVDPRAASVRQLAETSSFVHGLDRRPWPTGLRVTSVGARGDLVVPSPSTRVSGARHAVVSVPGLFHDHDALPASAAARREVGLAVAGLPPTCRGLADSLADALLGQQIARAETAAGLVVAGAGAVLPPGPVPPPARKEPS